MIETHKMIERDILRRAFLYEIQLEVNDLYLISEIEKHLEKTNLYYTTNVKGKMTAWNAFNKDDVFLETLERGSSHISQYINLEKSVLHESWGLKIEKGDYTARHHHSTSILSGILYLNEVDQVLMFPELNINVKPKKGTFLLFSPWLEHMTDVNKSEQIKYAIAFNFDEFKDKNWS